MADNDRSIVLMVVALAPAGDHYSDEEEPDPALRHPDRATFRAAESEADSTSPGSRTFSQIVDADVDLAATFLKSCHMTRCLPVDTVGKSPDGPDSVLLPDRGQTRVEGVAARIRSLRLLTLGAGSDLMAEFAIAELEPSPDETRSSLAAWIELVRLASRAGGGRNVAALLARRVRVDDRPVVVFSLRDSVGSDPANLTQLAMRLATRAPMSDRRPVLDDNDDRIAVTGEYQRRVVTARCCGFVTAGGHGSVYTRDHFRGEVSLQFVFAVALARWQRIQLNEIINQANSEWSDERKRSGARHLRSRFRLVTDLRQRHAALVATGVSGPVFESYGLRAFWDAVERVLSLPDRHRVAENSLQAMSDTTEVQSNLAVEVLIIAFTIIVGLPSLVFTIMGVNIHHFTTDDKESVNFSSVVWFLVASLVLGALAVAWTMGWPSTLWKRVDEKRRSQAGGPAPLPWTSDL